MTDSGLRVFSPVLVARELLRNLNRVHVFAQPGVINRNYQGLVAESGRAVIISSLGRVTVSDYARNEDLAPELLTSAQRQLILDQEKSFSFYVDDVDAKQSGVDFMPGAMEEAAFALRDVQDSNIAAAMATGATTTLAVTATTPGDAYDVLLKASVALDNKSVPMDGRFAVVTPEFEASILRDPHFIANNTQAGEDRLTNGIVGRAAGFTLVKSTNALATAATTGAGATPASRTVLAGHGIATTHAEQIVSVESMRSEKRFATLVRGLHVYGTKVVRPDALVAVRFSES